jgi:hypothetical protein
VLKTSWWNSILIRQKCTSDLLFWAISCTQFELRFYGQFKRAIWKSSLKSSKTSRSKLSPSEFEQILFQEYWSLSIACHSKCCSKLVQTLSCKSVITGRPKCHPKLIQTLLILKCLKSLPSFHLVFQLSSNQECLRLAECSVQCSIQVSPNSDGAKILV